MTAFSSFNHNQQPDQTLCEAEHAKATEDNILPQYTPSHASYIRCVALHSDCSVAKLSGITVNVSLYMLQNLLAKLLGR